MRWRLIVIGCLAVTLAIGFAVCATAAVDLNYRAQQVWNSGDNQPSQKAIDLSTRMYQQSWGLQTLMAPLGAGSLICGLAIPAVLARRWQLREATAASGAERAS